MRYVIDIYGVLVPALLLWIIVAYVLSALLRRLMQRFDLYRLVWHRALFDFAIFVCFSAASSISRSISHEGEFRLVWPPCADRSRRRRRARVGRELWVYYMEQPWTRDGRVRADVVQVAPDVSGFVTEVLVKDNQKVHRGDVLFRIDRERFALALRQADASVAGHQATLDQANADLKRYSALTTDAVSQQKQEQVLATQLQAKAAFDQAVADRAVAQLNLDRSEVHAVRERRDHQHGSASRRLRHGRKGVMALVDSDTLHVEGYFEETKLARIRTGDKVQVRLMGEKVTLAGHVESIAAGIEDRDRAEGASLLANVNPTFSWVRLAQRVPVRIALDQVPDRMSLVAGRSATVEVLD